jgi:hypothetical protein
VQAGEIAFENWRYVFFMFIEDHYFTEVKKGPRGKDKDRSTKYDAYNKSLHKRKNGALLH